MEGLSLPPNPTRVGGAQVDYSWQEICSIGNGVELLELVLASKNYLAVWFPRAFPRYWCIAEQSKDTPQAPYVRGAFVYQAYEQWADPNFGLGLGDIQISLGQGPR